MSLLQVESNGTHFNVRIVRQGDKYGLNDCITYQGTEPLVEFYDSKSSHSALGQFVSRYYMTTLLEGNSHCGINLDGGVPEWTIQAEPMKIVIEWLKSQNKISSPKLKM